MAIKVNSKNVLNIDLESDTKVFNADKMTALNLSNYNGYSFSTDGKTLIIQNGNNIITVNNSSKLKYIKSKDSDFQDIIATGLFTSIFPVTINPLKLSVSGATNFNDNINLSGVTGLTKTVKKEVLPKVPDDKGFSVNGGKGFDTITGSMYSDTLKGGDASDTISGGKGNDKIYGDNGSDILFGDGGNDTIYCGGDRDVVYGGIGNDIIYGNSGYNVHYFQEGDGQDKLYMGNGSDIIVFDNSLKDTLTYERSGNNLLINYGNSNDSVTIMNYFTAKNKSVDTIAFADYDTQNINITFEPGTTAESLSNNIIQNGNYEYWEFSSAVNPNNSVIYLCQVLNGDNNNNLIQSSKKYDIINPGDGDDFVQIQSNIAFVDDTSGNDKYFISSLNKGTVLTDYDGYDKIVINDSFKNVNFVFDVARDNNYNAYDEDILYVFNNSTLQKFIKTKNFLITSGIQINNYFNSGEIEQIDTKDCYITTNEIERIKNNVRIWLQNNNYNTALEALLYGSPATQKDLLAVYKNINWIKYTINGTAKNDMLTGTNYSEILLGGNGSDTILAKDGNDYVDGGIGNDYIETTDGESTIIGGQGNDIINGGIGNNTFIFNPGDGQDTIISGTVYDTIKINGKDFEDLSYTKSDNNLIVQYGQNDKITLQDFFYDRPVYDVMIDNTLKPIGEIISLNINGTDNADNITGTDYNDIITAKGGNDTINGGAGNNTYVFNLGDGQDTVISGTGEDTININGVSFDNLLYTKSNNDLIINYSQNDRVTLPDYFNGHSVQKIMIGDTIKPLQEIMNIRINGTSGADTITGTDINDIITAGGSNDVINGGLGNNTFVFNSGDGNDTIINDLGNDTIRLNAQSDLRFSHNLANNDLIMAYGNEDSVIIQDYFVNNSHSVATIKNGNQMLSVTEIIDTYGMDIIGSDGDDSITGTQANDVVTSNQGDDTINGEAGNNTYIFNTNDGNDIIINGGGNDTITFNSAVDLQYKHLIDNDDLVIQYGTDNSITLQDYFVNNSHSVQAIKNGNQTLSVTETLNTYGMDIIGSDGDDSITGTQANDTITSNHGNDTINGDAGNNTYVFNSGDGNNLIINSEGNDTIQFSEAMDLSYHYVAGTNNLRIQYGVSDSIILQDFCTNNSHSVNTIVNGNETISLSTITNDIIGVNTTGATGTNYNDTISRSSGGTIRAYGGNDYIEVLNDSTIYAGTGNDTINASNLYMCSINLSDGDGDDILITGGNSYFFLNFANSNIEDLSYSRFNNDLIIGYNSGNDSFTIRNFYTMPDFSLEINNKMIHTLSNTPVNNIYGENDTENTIYGSALNDLITGGNNPDSIYSGYGDDIIDSEAGNDYIMCSLGDVTVNGGAGNDYIDVNCYHGDSYIYGDDGNDSISVINNSSGGKAFIYGGNNDDTINVDSNHGEYNIDGGSGNDRITLCSTLGGNNKANASITGGVGNDTINGGAGKNTYVFSAGDGNDIIINAGGNDTIVFEENCDLSFSYNNLSNNKDLIISYGDEDKITLKNYYLNNSHSVKTITNGDETLSLEDTIDKYGIKIENYNNNGQVINGTSGNDLLSGGEGNDTIIGGSGNNDLRGQAGNDTYIVSLAQDSYDYILHEGGGNDTVIIQNSKDNIALYYNVTRYGLGFGTLYIKDKNCLTQQQGFEHGLFKYSDEYIIETTIINNNTESPSDDYVWIYDGEQINSITSEVASWLNTNNYDSVEKVITEGSKDDINSVLAIFAQVWQPQTV